jgi:hypothetical protein
MKVVINTDWGGFGLSDDAIRRYAELKGITLVEETNEYGITFYVDQINDESYFESHDFDRTDPALIQVVEEMGDASFGWAAKLKIVEIPDGVDWYVSDYDGVEHIAERHRTWY